MNRDAPSPQPYVLADLDLTDEAVAAQVHAVGLLAYRVEAELIGSHEIPALRERLAEMRARPLRWTGALSPDRRVGAFVAWQLADADATLDLDRVCVHPSWFRRGLASTLVRHVLEAEGPPRVTVSTGAANAPALALYQRLGFSRTGTTEPRPGLRLAHLELVRS